MLAAFIRTKEGYIVKAYDEGDDFRCPINKKDAYWFSKWYGDERGSILHALAETCRRVGATFDADLVNFVS